MAYSSATWNQLKRLTLKELAKVLKRDGWTEEGRSGATLGFIKTIGVNAQGYRFTVNPAGAAPPRRDARQP